MANVRGEVKDGGVIVHITGRIDSTNATDVENALKAIREENPDGSLTMDASELEYISSAGLRVVLRTRKAEPTFEIINVSSDVYEIFEMTGFSEMMTIKKAYRKFDVEGCEVIGQGSNGKVYRIDPETIIKVYKNPDSLPEIHRERELARKAFVLGVPTAIPYDVVKVGDGYGSVFELLNAESFAKLIVKDSDNFDKYVKMSANLLKQIHDTTLKEGEMPNEKEVVIGWVKFLEEYLPTETYEKLLKMVEDVEESTNLMHGDFHLKNIMMQNDEALLIDMDTLCLGDPIFELASMYNAYVGFGIVDPKKVEDFIGISYDVTKDIWRKSLEYYLDTDDDARIEEVSMKAELIGLVRIMRRSIRRESDTEQGQKLIETCKERIIEIVNNIDDLKI
ncbi:MAG: phosphotransferase [Eubacterium sp.]|nr:phosphotransferase [Eubacterium sp.]